MAVCEVCGASVLDGARDLCDACQKKAGLPDAARPRREVAPCLKCGGLELVRAQVRERTAGDAFSSRREANKEAFVPFAITYALSKEFAKLFSLKQVPSAVPNVAVPYGILEAYVCRACGYVEWYAQAPHEIPIAAALGTELVTVPAPKYR